MVLENLDIWLDFKCDFLEKHGQFYNEYDFSSYAKLNDHLWIKNIFKNPHNHERLKKKHLNSLIIKSVNAEEQSYRNVWNLIVLIVNNSF